MSKEDLKMTKDEAIEYMIAKVEEFEHESLMESFSTDPKKAKKDKAITDIFDAIMKVEIISEN